MSFSLVGGADGEQAFNPMLRFAIANRRGAVAPSPSQAVAEVDQSRVLPHNISRYTMRDVTAVQFDSEPRDTALSAERPETSDFKKLLRSKRESQAQREQSFTLDQSVILDDQKFESFLNESSLYQIKNYWEDYGYYRNDTRGKDLEVKKVCLLSRQQLLQFNAQMLAHSQTIFSENPVLLDTPFLIKNICLMLEGIQGQLFQLDPESLLFQIAVPNIQTHELQSIHYLSPI